MLKDPGVAMEGICARMWYTNTCSIIVVLGMNRLSIVLRNIPKINQRKTGKLQDLNNV